MNHLLHLMIFIAIFVGTNAYAYPPMIFHIKLHCPHHHHNSWCASSYWSELDSSSKDDPVFFFSFCTKNQTVYFEAPVIHMRGDGGMDGMWQKYYEISFKFYHTCSPHSARSCKIHPSHYSIRYKVQKWSYLHFSLNMTKNSYPLASGKCEMPEAFSDADYFDDTNGPLKDPFNFDRFDYDKVWFWRTSDQFGYLDDDE